MAECCKFECLICPACCKAPPKAAEPNSTTDPKVKTKLEKHPQTAGQMADATIVYVLGSVDGNQQLDEYSGLNGFHIRTIPGRRWAAPIMVGAGAGYLALVDRFQDYDLIRVTDKYGGAGTAGFDDDGFPLDSVDWANIPDLCAVPAGGRVTGLKITPRGMLIAHLAGTSTYLKFDVQGRATGSGVSKVMEGTQTLEPPFDVLGAMIGTPVFVNAHVGPHMFYTVALIRVTDGSYVVAIVDTLQHKVVGLQGLPSSPAPISATLSNNVMSVLCGDNGIGSQVIRFVVDFSGGGLLAGTRSDKKTPTPQSYTVNQFPELKDFNGRTFDPAQLHAYYTGAAAFNETGATRVIPDSFADLPEITQDSDVLNENRVSAAGFIVSQYYGTSMRVPAQFIPVPAALGLTALESGYGTVTELFQRHAADGTIDRVKPLFRVLHGGHYDIIAEGGYTYGSGSTGVTNGMIGESLATDKDYELGKLKLAYDAKAALVEAGTGLLFFREPKPRGGYRVYGGNYAALDPVQDNSALEVEILALQDDLVRLQTLDNASIYSLEASPETLAAMAWLATLTQRLAALGMTGMGIRRTQATLDTENAVQAVDGVERSVVSPWASPWLIPARTTPNGAPVAAFDDTTGSMDDYWSMYVRAPGLSDQFDAILMRRSWSSAYDDFGVATLLPEWAASNESPISCTTQQLDILVPWRSPQTPIDFPPTLNAVGRGGFFVRGLPYVWMSNVDRYNEEAAALTDLNDDYRRAQGGATPEIVAQYSGYIAENLARIAYIRTVPLWGDIPLTPRNILGMKFHKLSKSAGQNIVAPVWDDMTVAPQTGATIPIGAVTGKRGCVINGGPWAFVAVTVRFTADNIHDGVDVYGNPEDRRNGLGIKVDDWSPPADNEGYYERWHVVGGSHYEAGYKCSEITGAGAWGTWGYTIEGGPRIADPSAPLGIRDPLINIDDLDSRQLWMNMLAPEDAKALLLGDAYGDMGYDTDEVFQKTHYYLTQTPLASIKVKFWLRHHASDVFRWGWWTVSHDYAYSGSCYEVDPGFNTGNGDPFIHPDCGGTWPFLGGNQRLADSPIYPQLGHDVLMGTAVFKCAPNPYTGRAYGSVWKCNVDFNFNNNLRGLDVPLVPGDVETPGT